jgi:rsbT antagonist protein RsbS
VKRTIPILRIGQILLVTVDIDLEGDLAEAMQNDLLMEIEKHGAKGLVIDISGLDTVDSYVARMLAETQHMARLMGTSTVLVGMRPEVAATLVRMGYGMSGVRTALNLEEGLLLLGYRLTSV